MYSIIRFRTHYWPVLTSLWIFINFLTTYIIAVLNDHVYPILPYISDTGTLPPESCIFGQTLNMGSCFMAITIYLRYRQIKFLNDVLPLNITMQWNVLSKYIGLLSCFGMSIVANFQETSLGWVHFVGAFTCFALGALYYLMQTRISFAVLERQKNPSMEYSITTQLVYFRAALSILMMPLFIINLITGFMAMLQIEGVEYYYWPPEKSGYKLHIVSAVNEWLVAFCIFFYVLTFHNEFKALEFMEIRMENKMK